MLADRELGQLEAKSGGRCKLLVKGHWRQAGNAVTRPLTARLPGRLAGWQA